ncbi:SAM-dependent methyltransferase [Dactylosporangium sp. CA-092794]|uniref:SAM-dependent methyltransferase n=1 Tax=Dactylosporangium sp. CA-092794 TaxID=3239929 RepID=UPI003D8EF376
MTARDWVAWHAAYDDDTSDLARRLRRVQACLDDWLDERPEPLLRVVSACAGEGRDLLGVLERRADAGRVRARLIEFDPGIAAAARAAAAGLAGVEVACADAGDLASYAGAVPADLVLLAGVLGNITDDDARATIAALPALCAEGATVIWTRGRAGRDVTPALRAWLAAAGFAERAFHAPGDSPFSVGVHRFDGRPRPLPAAGRIFAFIA